MGASEANGNQGKAAGAAQGDGANDAGGTGGAEGTLHVAFVLDRSGSMHVLEEGVVAGFNAYLAELRAQGGETLFSLTLFDTRFEHVCTGIPLAEVPELDHARYRPEGCTALFDAVGHCVVDTDRRLTAAGREGDRVLVAVLTDGQENSSTDYDGAAISQLIAGYDARPNWTFVYLGAGHATLAAEQDAAARMGYRPDNAMRWAPDAASARKSMDALARATQVRRASRAGKSETFFADAGQSDADYREWPLQEPQPKPQR